VWRRDAYGETTDDGVGNVSNAGLDGQEVIGKPTVLDFVLEEFDQVAGNGT
jgi:hypothetical protein